MDSRDFFMQIRGGDASFGLVKVRFMTISVRKFGKNRVVFSSSSSTTSTTTTTKIQENDK